MENLYRVLKIYSCAIITSTLCFIVGGFRAVRISGTGEGCNEQRNEVNGAEAGHQIRNFDVQNSRPYKFFRDWRFEWKEIIPIVTNSGVILKRNETRDPRLLMKRLDQEWDTLCPILSLKTSNFLKNLFKDEKTREEVFEKYEENWWEEYSDEGDYDRVLLSGVNAGNS